MNNTIKRTWNQGSMVNIEDLRGMTFQAESGGHTFVISAVDADGNAVSLSGTPAGTMLRPDNTDQALTCSVSGGKVYATLPAGCYDVPGRAGITIFLTSGGQKAAIYAAVVSVTRTQSGTASPGTTASVVDLVNAINTAISGIPATDTALKAAMAPTYSNSALYAVGEYAWYNGTLYRCTTAITTAETWTSGHWTAAAIGTDSANGLRELKSAFNNSLSTSVKSTFHTENPGSAFLFLIGNINTDTGARVSSNVYAALTGYQAVENSFFGMTTDDYYYRVVYTRSNQTSTGNVIYATDYVKGTNITGLNYPGAAYYKVVAVKDLTGTVSMEGKLDDVLSKSRFYMASPFQLDTSLTQSGKAADAKVTGDIISTLIDDIGTHTVDLITNASAFVNTDQSYLNDGTAKTYAGWDTSDYIECTPGQTLAFRLVGFNKTISGSPIILATIAFFNSEYGFVESWYYNETTSGTQVEDECVVPFGAAYFKALYNDEYMTSTPYVKVLPSGICEEIEDLQSRVPNKIPVKIAFVGDSLTQGMTGGTSGAYTFASKPYPTICKEMLGNRGFDVTAKNFGRRGLSAKSYWNTAIPSNGTSHSPATGEPGDIISFDNTIDAVIIMFGTNGSLVANTIAEDTAISGSQTYLDYADTQCGDYCKIIEYIMEETENHAQIILIAPIYSTEQEHEQKMINTLPTIQALGQRYQIPVINALYESGLGKFNTNSFYNTTDKVHLNQAGYHKFGTFMASKFSSLYSTFDMDELPSS